MHAYHCLTNDQKTGQVSFSTINAKTPEDAAICSIKRIGATIECTDAVELANDIGRFQFMFDDHLFVDVIRL